MAGLADKLISFKNKSIKCYNYCANGVWSDMRPLLSVRLIKTLNLSVRSFFDGDIQTKACAMTYRTFLAFVPALALIFAIGKGFGLQKVIKDEIIKAFPSQNELLERAFTFVDSYLSQSSEGLFLGIGIALLLWTLISLLGSVENAFNDIWGVKSGRSIWRKMTDYLAIFLILPVLMICASGMTVFVTTSAQQFLPAEFVTPLMSAIIDIVSVLLIWIFFTGVYMMIPTTKVKFKNAFGAGVFAGTGYLILQWLFISGQVYVSKYNAIYGSFAFFPLFLIWVQFIWVVTLSGAVICYASQNIFRYNFATEISNMSHEYRLKFTVAVMTIIVQNYLKNQKSTTEVEIINDYKFPARLVSSIIDSLTDCNLLLKVVISEKDETIGYVPAIDSSQLTLADVIQRYRQSGTSDFIPEFDEHFNGIIDILNNSEDAMQCVSKNSYLKDFPINIILDKK